MGLGDLFNITGDNGWGTKLVDSLSGAKGAQAQADASTQASQQGQDFIRQQSELGNQYIDTGLGQAQGALQVGLQGGQTALGSSYQGAMGQLGSGYNQALGAIGGQQNRLGDLYGGGLASGFQQDPGYQFRQQQGEQAINRMAAAQGGRLGGANLKALMNFNQNLASGEFNNYANRQMGLAQGADAADWQRNSGLAGLYQGLGQQQSGLTSQYGSNQANLSGTYGSQLAQLYGNAGTNKASNAQGVGGQVAQLGMMPSQYAGGAQTATGNFLGGAIGTFGGKALDHLWK